MFLKEVKIKKWEKWGGVTNSSTKNKQKHKERKKEQKKEGKGR